MWIDKDCSNLCQNQNFTRNSSLLWGVFHAIVTGYFCGSLSHALLSWVAGPGRIQLACAVEGTLALEPGAVIWAAVSCFGIFPRSKRDQWLFFPDMVLSEVCSTYAKAHACVLFLRPIHILKAVSPGSEDWKKAGLIFSKAGESVPFYTFVEGNCDLAFFYLLLGGH